MTNDKIEDQLIALKEEIEASTGEELEVGIVEDTSKESTKAKKSKKSAEKKEKKESPLIKLAQITEELGIPGLDAKTARKILRKTVKTEEGKATWAWETQEEADVIKATLQEAYNTSKESKAQRAEERALKSEERKAQKEAQKAQKAEEKEADQDEAEGEVPEIKEVKSSKRKSSKKN